MWFVMSPEAGFLIAVVIIGWLIVAGVKSIVKNAPSADPDFKSKYDEIMKNMGPMTWKERIVSAVIIIVFVALVAWIASIT